MYLAETEVQNLSREPVSDEKRNRWTTSSTQETPILEHFEAYNSVQPHPRKEAREMVDTQI